MPSRHQKNFSLTKRNRCYVFVLNNYDENDFDNIWQINYRGISFQEEVGENTHTRHFQGFIRFWTNITGHQVIRQFREALGHTRTSFEQCIDAKASYAYSCKQETRSGEHWEDGDLDFVNTADGKIGEQGKRTDLRIAADKLKAGATIRELCLDHTSTMVKHLNGFRAVKSYLDFEEACKERTVAVWWLWGKTGMGKSKLAYSQDAATSVYKLPDEGQKKLWFGVYDGQRTLLIDDIGLDTMSFEVLLQVTDRYRYEAPVKGGHVWAKWTAVVITCQDHYTTLYAHIPANKLEALRRRITYERYFGDGKDMLPPPPAPHTPPHVFMAQDSPDYSVQLPVQGSPLQPQHIDSVSLSARIDAYFAPPAEIIPRLHSDWPPMPELLQDDASVLDAMHGGTATPAEGSESEAELLAQPATPPRESMEHADGLDTATDMRNARNLLRHMQRLRRARRFVIYD